MRSGAEWFSSGGCYDGFAEVVGDLLQSSMIPVQMLFLVFLWIDKITVQTFGEEVSRVIGFGHRRVPQDGRPAPSEYLNVVRRTRSYRRLDVVVSANGDSCGSDVNGLLNKLCKPVVTDRPEEFLRRSQLMSLTSVLAVTCLIP